MSTRHACAFYLAVLASCPALAQTGTPESAVEPAAAVQAAPDGVNIDETAPARIVVSGRRPGPGVWKVSKGEHVMWVFGTYSPLPQKMEWDSARIERLVAASQEVLLPPAASGHVGFFRGVTLLPSLVGIRQNPDGAQLRQVLPAEVYARWTGLKQKYDFGDEVESYRPLFAGGELLRAAMKKNGLVFSSQVVKTIEAIARKNDVRLSRSGFDYDVADPRRMIKDFKQSQLDDLACFSKTLDSLDTDIDAMRTRANAWANGDIAEIAKLDYRGREDACNDAILNSTVVKNAPEFQDIPKRLRATWLTQAEKSLAGNASTFAILHMKDIVGAQGYLAALQDRGYTVESPR